MYFLERLVFKAYLISKIYLLWIYWYPRYYHKLSKVYKILYSLNNHIPYFKKKFSLLNKSNFNYEAKYWNHWIRKMDPREQIVFKEWNPIILITDEDWLHLDMSKMEIPIVNYTYYWPNSEWIAVNIFDSLLELQNYFSLKGDTAEELVKLVKRITSIKTDAITLKSMIKNKNENISNIFGNDYEKRLAPDYFEKRRKQLIG